jgi:hypothetical protein
MNRYLLHCMSPVVAQSNVLLRGTDAVAIGGIADMPGASRTSGCDATDPKRSFGRIAGLANWPKIWRGPEREVITDRAMEAWYHLFIA